MTATALSGSTVTIPGHGVGHRSAEQERAEQVGDRGHEDGRERPRCTRGDQRGDGVGGIVEAVREREGERHRDGCDEDDVHGYAPAERAGSVFIAAIRPSCPMAAAPAARASSTRTDARSICPPELWATSVVRQKQRDGSIDHHPPPTQPRFSSA